MSTREVLGRKDILCRRLIDVDGGELGCACNGVVLELTNVSVLGENELLYSRAREGICRDNDNLLAVILGGDGKSLCSLALVGKSADSVAALNLGVDKELTRGLLAGIFGLLGCLKSLRCLVVLLHTMVKRENICATSLNMVRR